MAYKNDDEVTKGTTWIFPITIQDTLNDPVDYSTYKVYLAIKKDFEDSDENAIYIDDRTFNSAGECTFIISADDNVNFPTGYWKRAIKVIGPGIVDEAVSELKIIESGVKAIS